MAESESAHRRELNSQIVTSDISTRREQLEIDKIRLHKAFRSDLYGQVLGTLVSLVCVASGIYLAFIGQPWVAGVALGLPLAGIIKALRDKTIS